MPVAEGQSIAEIVAARARREPERVCVVFHEGERETDRVTYGGLAREAAAFARLFRARGLRPGDPMVLFAHSVRAFVSALLGAQQAGLLAVPCPPPERLESGRRVLERVTDLLERCGAKAVFDPAPGSTHTELAPALAERPWIALAPADLAQIDEGEPDDPSLSRTYPFAYCQFTSGSGGRAKGVLITHKNIEANIRAMNSTFGLGETDVAVTWLPLFHDFGLVAGVFMPLLLGQPCHVMSPLAFLGAPASWLRLISRVRGVISGAPNFAYALCARRIADSELAGVDLSSWRMASNGAEPITREAVTAFAERFASVGFRASALKPGYGLAENTLSVSSRAPGEGVRFEDLSREALEREGRARLATADEPRSTVASVGRPYRDVQLVILDGLGAPLGEREVGEIAVRGDSVMSGYLPGTSGEAALRPDGWLLTGDLGYLADGELFVVGRKKDLIIRGGRKYYPQDLEEAAAEVPGVRRGRVVAFSIPGPDAEHVVLTVEVREGSGDAEALRAAIRQAVFGVVRFLPDDLVLLPPHALPLTSSGKVMRPEARRLYLEKWRAGPL